MKHKTLLLAALSAVVLVAGCDKPTTSQQIDQLKAETQVASRELKEKNYTYAQKAEFTEKMQSHLAEINRDLDQLSAKVEKSSAEVKAEVKPKLQALREQTAELNKQLDGVRNATESTWDSAKDGFWKAYETLMAGFQQARQWVSDKIAP